MKPFPSPLRRPRLLRRRAFTRTDLLVMLAVVAVLGSLAAGRATTMKRKTHLARCTVNVNEINRAVLGFAADNNQTLPSEVPGNPGNLWWW
jgi:Tfp pilus assembly protein FimT